MYRTLFFDVDNTLLDFTAAEHSGLERLYNDQGLTLTEELKGRYKVINQGLWKEYEQGKITLHTLLCTRHAVAFRELGKELDGYLLEKQYRTYLGEGSQMMPGAFEIIKALQGEFDLYITTNGVAATQNKRLALAGMHDYFKDIFVSDEIGYQKPQEAFFETVFNRINGFSKKESMVIGDSLSADIAGGHAAGIDTCWYNPHQLPNESEMVPTYEIHHLSDLLQLLKVKESSVQ